MSDAQEQKTTLPEVPPGLVDAGVQNRLVILVGAGVSYGAGLPSWAGLLRDLLVEARSKFEAGSDGPGSFSDDDYKAVKDAISNNEFLVAASMIEFLLVDPDSSSSPLATEIVRRFKAVPAKPTKAHRALAVLTGVRFLTTNYDQLLEVAMQEKHGRRPTVVTAEDTSGIADFGPGDVFKIHGDLDQPNTIVLSNDDYNQVAYDDRRN